MGFPSINGGMVANIPAINVDEAASVFRQTIPSIADLPIKSASPAYLFPHFHNS
jgi:hypothetical protein